MEKNHVGYWIPKDKTICFEDEDEDEEDDDEDEHDEELVEDSDESDYNGQNN